MYEHFRPITVQYPVTIQLKEWCHTIQGTVFEFGLPARLALARGGFFICTGWNKAMRLVLFEAQVRTTSFRLESFLLLFAIAWIHVASYAGFWRKIHDRQPCAVLLMPSSLTNLCIAMQHFRSKSWGASVVRLVHQLRLQLAAPGCAM